jgi:cholesterol oxidase
MTNFNTSRRRLLLGGAATLAASTLGAFASPKSSAKTSSTTKASYPKRQRVKALVIGSGFGGAIAACRLAEKGIDTLVLERGRRWTTKPGSKTFSTYRQPDSRAVWLTETDLMVSSGPIDPVERYVGLVQRRDEDGITVWVSSGVGGGSLVYNTVLLQPSKDNFYKCFPASVSYDEMNREYYPRVVEALRAGPIPDDILLSNSYAGARVFQDLANRAGLPLQRLNVGTDWHVVRKELNGQLEASAIAGEIWYGGNSGYKNSLDKNYLKSAEESGHATISELSDVTSIAENGSRYLVSFNRIDEHGNILSKHQVDCDYLFMGAGSMGTSALLTKAKALGTLPKLNSDVGKYWGNNGDTFGQFDTGSKERLGDIGGPATFAVLDYKNPYGPQTVIVYPTPNNSPNFLQFLGMSIPKDSGYWDYDKASNTARLHFPDRTPAQKEQEAGMQSTLTRLAESLTPPSTAETAVKSIKVHSSATAHPCGGAVMGKACDLYGRVQGYSGLYVVDGAFIPLGTAATNPSLTIAAFAERSMQQLLSSEVK